MDTPTFAALLHQAVTEVFPAAHASIATLRHTRLKARIDLEKGCYIDIFFREETQRIDYALIRGGERLFGIDNLKGWHYHPLADPLQHLPCTETMPLEALQQIRRVYAQLG